MHCLKAYRIKNNLTRDALGKILGCTGSMIGHIEVGRRGVLAERALEWEEATQGQIKREELLPDLFQGFRRVRK